MLNPNFEGVFRGIWSVYALGLLRTARKCYSRGKVSNIYKVTKSTSSKCILLKKKKIRRSLREGAH